MDEEDIERLTSEQHRMLRAVGFGWAAEKAAAALPTGESNRKLVH